MKYRDFGRTGVKISVLGFGAMRLPMEGEGESARVREEESIAMIRRAIDLGVNYVDTAYGYCNGQSELVVGKALKGYRDRVYLSTKCPTWKVEKPGDYRMLLEEQLRKLDTDHIDFYHFHALGKDRFENIVEKHGLIEEARKAKEEGLIRHISFSFHDTPEYLVKLIDTGAFETLLCQFNLLDRANEEAIAYARSKGLGTVIMGPVGGGRLGTASSVIRNLVPGGVKTTAEIALRFVLANENVTCALSGMNSMAMVEENAEIASRDSHLSAAELALVTEALEENRRLADLYCTGCDYCLPCPQGVKISTNFKLMNYHRVYGLTEYGRRQYEKLKTEERADACVECGECEPKCPQNIEIRKQLAETARVLG